MDIQKQLTVDCVADSYASQYFYERFVDTTDYLMGDFNKDGELNIRDVTAIQEYLVATYTGDVTDIQLKIADVTRDNNLNIRDVTRIQEHLVGSVESL